jgi:hypothetical protein
MKHLFETFMTDCTMIDRRSTPDGEGGFDYEWVDGASFKAAIVKDNSLTARVAEKQGVTEVYKVTVPKGTPLGFHDVVRREQDGAIFRVTSNIVDSETPDVAGFQFGQVTAERWELV